MPRDAALSDDKPCLRSDTEADAQVGEAQAQIATATLDLGYTRIRAPVDGTIGNRAARVGAYVTVGSYLLSVIHARGLWVDANFTEDQLAHMHVAADVAPAFLLATLLVPLMRTVTPKPLPADAH